MTAAMRVHFKTQKRHKKNKDTNRRVEVLQVLNLLSETFEKSAMLKDQWPANWLHTTQSSYPKIDVERSGAGWTWCVLLKPAIIQLCQDVEINSMHSLHITILWYKCMHKNEWYIRLINMYNIIAICFNTTL